MKNPHFKDTKALKKSLLNELAYIRKTYQRILFEKKSDSNAEWLCDNYYILEKEGRSLAKELGRHLFLPCSGSSPFLYYDLLKYLDTNENNVSFESLDSFIEERQNEKYYQSSEIYVLPQMLKVCLLHNACDCLKNNGRLGNIIRSLRFMGSIDFDEINKRHIALESILHADPAGAYSFMDEQSRALYIRLLSKTARREGLDEIEVAKNIINAAQNEKEEIKRHIGYFILNDKAEHKKRTALGKTVLAVNVLLPIFIAVFLSVIMERWWFFPILYLPFFEIVRIFCEYFALRKAEALPLPRMDIDNKVPENAGCMIVVSSLLSSPDKNKSVTKRLEQLFYTNGRGEVTICLLADLKQSGFPSMPEDKAIIDSVSRQIDALNRKHGGKFMFFVRKRVFSKTQNAYMGWERKRGAITELVRLIMGEEVSPEYFIGNRASLKKTKYIVCLDSDTQLLMDTVPQMVGAALHPLHQPVVADGAVRAGYGIIAPKMSSDIRSAGVSSFSRIMAGARGISVYDTISSDFYMDTFKEGIFAGKGLINVEAFYAVMNYKLPNEQILSHDSIESGFLRCAYMSDVEMSDGFPSGVISCRKRQHRWIRGDMQNGDYCFNKELNTLTRYKLSDNIRRAVTPFFSLVCMLFCTVFPSGSSNLIAASVMLSLCGSQLFSAAMTIIHGGPDMISRKYYSKVLPDALLNLAQGLIKLIMFVDGALNDLDAVVRAVYRSLFSKKKLLEWTTAADSEKGGGFLFVLNSHLFSTLASVALLVLATGSIARLLFFLSALIIPFSYLTSIKTDGQKTKLNDEQKDTLLGYAAAMCGYYEDLFCREDHYLPPDNIQEAPVSVIAHRTSPTNIGLMMLGFLSARDFGFIDNATLFDRISKSTATVERLEKWHGNLLNWYDLRTLAPLRPRYVSTVDSGNFVSNLVVLKNGLIEYNAPNELVNRIDMLIEQTDLTPFYNKNRKLFHIGFDMEKNELTNSYYDLLMSESRITSYYAIATRQIPKKHWGALGRTLARQGGFTGPVSWTGTMFEYFMPALFLPVYEGTLCYESLKFCNYCQKKRVNDFKSDMPYGISESGFYAFDSQLSYQYKAHGVQKIGLKRGLDSELVISPYSSFLALPSGLEAYYNLKRLERLNMTGRYGFYEAVDFSGRRVKNNPKIVKSFMAHHVGMSILAVNNALNDDIIMKRFVNDSRMSCATELLEEKIPCGAVVFEDVSTREIPDKTAPRHSETEEFEEINPLTPRMSLLSNGEMTCLLTDSGAGVTTYHSVDLTRRSSDLLKNPIGFFALVRSQGKVFSITDAPLYDRAAKRRTEFGSNFIAFYAQSGETESGMMVSLHKEFACEQRKIIIKNKSGKKRKIELLLYFEPLMTTTASELAHPAFAKLFIESFYDKSTNSVIFKRRNKANEPPVYMAAGLREDIPFLFETDREKALTCPLGISSLKDAFDKEFSGCSGVFDHCFALKTELELAPKSQRELSLLICSAPTLQEALKKLVAVRRESLNVTNSAKSPLSDLSIESRVVGMILPFINYPLRENKDIIPAIRENTLGQSALWSMGISGDRKIILIEIISAEDAQRCESLIKALLILRLCYIKIDLAVIFSEGGAYNQPITTALNEIIKECAAEQLVGADGGIHPVDIIKAPSYALNLLKACACFIADAGMNKVHPLLPRFTPIEILNCTPKTMDGEIKAFNGFFKDKSFFITDKPSVPWCHVLANKNFGTLVSNYSPGYTWAVNSRENKLTPWQNDTRSDNSGEQLLINIEKKYYNLINGATAEFCADYARYRSIVEGLSITVTISVPSKGMRKSIDVTIKGATDTEYRLIYYTEPVLSFGGQTGKYLCAKWEKGSLLFRNSFNTAVKGIMLITAIGGADDFVCDRGAFLSGRLDSNTLSPLIDNCGAVILKRHISRGGENRDTFVMAFASNENAVFDLVSRRLPPTQAVNKIKISTPDKQLDCLVNSFLPHQIIKGRMFARTAFYQCSGAYGFRDQLQDSGAALLIDSKLTKQQITRACAHQFLEGDVLHWWHSLPKSGGGEKGVRTKYSDDLLWLLTSVADYVEKTGDYAFLETKIAYLTAPELGNNDHEVYISAEKSDVSESVYKHCLRALDRVSYGKHGLPLMGGGDWCDGYNLVGIEGTGESVWVAMFLAMSLERFAIVCEAMNDTERKDFCINKSAELKKNIDEHAYDGKWYLRAFYDNGEKLGAESSDECKIDSLTQSFAVLCGMPDRERVESALHSTGEYLVDRANGLIRLFTPPFHKSENPVGYVINYPKGIRENGGQYTHGIIWYIIALLRFGQTDKAYELIRLLNPAHKPEKGLAKVYALEPYYIAADIYDNPRLSGRGGWSIYTGAAGWYYRLVVEELLGIKLLGDKIKISPRLPSSWDEVTLELEIKGTKIKATISHNFKETEIPLDGGVYEVGYGAIQAT